MIQLLKTGQIKKSGSIAVNGEILKIGVLTEKPMNNVRFKVTSFFDEVLADDNLRGEKTLFYPIVAPDGSPDIKNFDHFYIAGNLNIFVEGLAEGESIKDILIYYK